MTNGAHSPESEADVQQGMAMIDQIAAWALESEDLPDPLPGSMLAEEDRLNPYEPGTQLSRFYDGVCRDNLGAVSRACIVARDDEDNALPAYALYSQVRAAIESIGWAYWLTVGNTKQKRLYRALSITYGHAVQFDEALQSLGEDWRLQSTLDRLIEIARDARIQKEIRSPGTTSDMLREVDRAHAPDGITVLNAWKLCSGIAHGSRPIAYNLSERLQLSPPDERGGVKVDLRARVGMVAALASVALSVMIEFRVRYMFLGTHGYDGRPIAPNGEH